MRSRTMIRRIATTVVAVLAVASGTIQASAADGPSVVTTRSDGATVRTAPGADDATTQWAASNPQAAAAASNACGGKYTTLAYVDSRLPGDTTGEDNGSMLGYVGGGLLCVLFVNETPGGANYMYLRACPGTVSSTACGQDDGYFDQYAGPLYISQGSGGCFTVSYNMRNEKNTLNLINGKRSYSC
ncbi:hypothetical protein ACFXIY_10240 [Streptomyces albidoflavus]